MYASGAGIAVHIKGLAKSFPVKSVLLPDESYKEKNIVFFINITLLHSMKNSIVPTESMCIPLPICLCAYVMHSEALPSNSFDLHCLYAVLLFLTKCVDLSRRPKLCLYFRSTRIRTERNRNPVKLWHTCTNVRNINTPANPTATCLNNVLEEESKVCDH